VRNGISAGPLPDGIKYGAPIQKAGDDYDYSPVVCYAIADIETISVEDWIEATWPGRTAATVITGNGVDDPYGYGMFQETPETSGNQLPVNWEDPYVACTFAIKMHLARAEAFWVGIVGPGEPLVRCIAAEYNAGRSGALEGHHAGDVGMYTTTSGGVSYPDRVLAVYRSLVKP
jgi:hypothetical protein